MSFEAKACLAEVRFSDSAYAKSVVDASGSFGQDWFESRAAKSGAALIAFARSGLIADETVRGSAIVSEFSLESKMPADSLVSAYDGQPATQPSSRVHWKPLEDRSLSQFSDALSGGGLNSFQHEAR